MRDRGKVWLGAAGIVINSEGKWLVVKKGYSALKGAWSLPAGFVHVGETVDEAAVREVKEETGIDCEVTGLVGLRTGVIREDISDNMIIFCCKPVVENQPITIQKEELTDAGWMTVEELLHDENTSILLKEIAGQELIFHQLVKREGLDPGNSFNYTCYKLFYND